MRFSVTRAHYATLGYSAANFSRPTLDVPESRNRAISSARGGGMSLALLDRQTGLLKYGGIGNMRGLHRGRKTTPLNSCYGTVSVGYRNLIAESLSFDAGVSVSVG